MASNVDILTPLQKEFLAHVFSDLWFRRYFYLTGGTALSAFYLFHRYSEDLDFFSHGVTLDSIPDLIESFGKKAGLPVERVQTERGFQRYQITEELKIDVVADIDFRVGSPELIDNCMIDSLKNIAVNKVTTILGRLDAKDYVDLYFLFKENQFNIFELIHLGQKKDGGLEPFVWASLIADVKRLPALPRMIKTITVKELQDFFLGLRDQILDKINPEKQLS